jgi:hypothetical protein
MDVPRLLLIAAAGVAASVVPPAQAQPDDPEALAAEARGAPKPWKPWKHVRGSGRVLDLSMPPVVIDEPGPYAIQQNWRFPPATTAVVTELIQITANNVTLDLHGFEISAEGGAPPRFTLFVITGHSAEIRNGGLAACCEGAVTVHSTGRGMRLHHLSVFSHETMTFDGDLTSLTDSDISPRVGIRFAGRSNLERNAISCNRGRCVTLLGDGSRITDNKMSLSQGGGVRIMGNRNVVANNVVDVTDAVDAGEAFEVEGDNNVVRGNTVLLGGITANASAIYVISGTGNTLDGNIAAPPTPTERAQVGMQFTADGNYYGDNRMAAQVPFELGGTVQTDWGGNVDY